jgi:hypothetical protein
VHAAFADTRDGLAPCLVRAKVDASGSDEVHARFDDPDTKACGVQRRFAKPQLQHGD